jgi:hypothetical protein
MTSIPWERRPVENPVEAKAAALQSMHASRQARSQPRRKASPARLTPSAQAYLIAELQWQAVLRRRRRLYGRSGRDQLDLARAKRARLRRTEAYVHGSDAHRLGKYSEEEVTEYAEQGKALKLPNGKYGYVILDTADLMNSLQAYKTGDRPTGLRGWIIERAVLLGLFDQLPAGWAQGKQKPRPGGPSRPKGLGGGEVGMPEGGGQGGSSSTGGSPTGGRCESSRRISSPAASGPGRGRSSQRPRRARLTRSPSAGPDRGPAPLWPI